MEETQEQQLDYDIDSCVADAPELIVKPRFPTIEALEEYNSEPEALCEPRRNVAEQHEPQPPIEARKTKAKVKKAYTMSPAAVERNKKLHAENRRRRAAEKKKLEEYEKLVKLKGVSREDVEGVLNEKLQQLEERLTTRRAAEVPPKLEVIQEEAVQGYTSDTQRRFSNRFKKVEPTSPAGYGRFRKM